MLGIIRKYYRKLFTAPAAPPQSQPSQPPQPQQAPGPRRGPSAVSAPIIVYQMAKVGSTSVYHALRKLNLGVPVYQCHVLNGLEAMEEAVKQSFANPQGTLEAVRYGKEVRDRFLAYRGPKWNLISMVREPVGRNVSHFFQGITERIPDFYEQARNNTLDMAQLAELFLQDHQVHVAPMWWFETQLKGFFGIDVFQTPFPIETGYATYENDRARLLLMRLENLAECAQPALGQFLGIRGFELEKRNVGEDKDYAAVYRRFKQEARLPVQYLDQTYGSPFARHFYSDEEIRRFRESWLRPTSPAQSAVPTPPTSPGTPSRM